MSNRSKRQQHEPRDRRWQNMPPRPPREPKAPELCAFCGYNEANTREHVFAKSLFLPAANPTITVPACQECNAGYGDGCHRRMSLDEEYFRQVLVSIDGAERHPVAAKILHGPARTCFDRSPGLRASFLQSVKETLVANKSGILTPATSWTPEWERIDRVLRKITRGLFYHYMKRRMDVETAVIVRSRLNQETFDALAIDMKSANTLGPIGLGENGAVIFSGARTSEACDDTMWLFNFYQVFGAFTLTLSRATAIKWGSA